MRALSPAQILERLERRLPLLTGGPRDAPERQQTLRATIAWSYELLSADEQELFRGLGVFAGGWTLEAAEQVAGGDLESLQSLVEKSLVRFDGERYSMLETIREYALEQLEERAETEQSRRRHAQFFLELAEATSSAEEADYGGDYTLPDDGDNFRAAIDWSVAADELELGLRIAVALEQFWVINDVFEGIRRFEELLANSEKVDPLLRARALRCYGGCCHSAGRFLQSVRASEESLTLFREARDDRGVAVLLHRLAFARQNIDEPELTRPLLEESLELYRRVGSRRGEAEVLAGFGYLAQRQGDLERAVEFYTESLRMAVEVGFTWWVRNMRIALADAKLELERPNDAESDAWEALRLAHRLGDRRGVFWSVVLLAWAAAIRGNLRRAGRLWGAALAESERRPIGQWEHERELYTGRVARDTADFRHEEDEGRRLWFDRAVEEELAGAAGAAGADALGGGHAGGG